MNKFDKLEDFLYVTFFNFLTSLDPINGDMEAVNFCDKCGTPLREDIARKKVELCVNILSHKYIIIEKSPRIKINQCGAFTVHEHIKVDKEDKAGRMVANQVGTLIFIEGAQEI